MSENAGLGQKMLFMDGHNQQVNRMHTTVLEDVTVAEAYLELLAARGIRYFFGNSGTDFAPLIEGFAKRRAQGKDTPRPVTVPHEITAVAMAHGYAMVTGEPQAVMVHVTVGTANALGGIINAFRARVPMFFTAGRTPLTEKGYAGARDLGIHWAQESFDQGAMVREFVKWDYELRLGGQLETVIDRALAVTRSAPQGPVYLSLPREVLAARMDRFAFSTDTRICPSGPVAPDTAAVESAARALAAARNPLAVTRSLGRNPRDVKALVALAETFAIPVVDHWHTHMNFPQDHPLHAGFDPAPYLKDADLILALESDAPWFPQLGEPDERTRVIQIASDPLFASYPIRGFPVDFPLPGDPGLSLAALRNALLALDVDRDAVENRRERWREHHRQQRGAWKAAAEATSGAVPIDMAWASHCVSRIIDRETIVVNEYVLRYSQSCFTVPGSYFHHSPAASLGWGLGAALGAKLAQPGKFVVCCVGDGAYLFGVPTSAHWMSRALNLPILYLVFNNGRWNASQQATLAFAPDGWAAKADSMPLCDLTPSPDYELICRAAGGHGERVEDPGELPRALERAVHAVKNEKRQALLNIVCA